ncbi:MAG: hypothetical protein AB1656_18950 [Candidatus Omnitrophota bacterium]
MMLNTENENTAAMIPLKTLEGISVVDSHLNHVVSIASLADPAQSNSKMDALLTMLRFPGLKRAFRYFYENNKIHGIPASIFGPTVIQLQPGDTMASLLYIEKSFANGLMYSIERKKFHLEDGLPSFSKECCERIYNAEWEQMRAHFNRVHPVAAVLSTLISLANAIYIVDHRENESVMSLLADKIEQVQHQRKTNAKNPTGLLLAPYGQSRDGKDFSIEPLDSGSALSGAWKEDFLELMSNFRDYLPPLLDYVNKNTPIANPLFYVNKSIGPIRLKFDPQGTAIGLFLHIRSNSHKGYEFWLGSMPYEGTPESPAIQYDKITILKREIGAAEILVPFPSIDALDLLLPAFLQVGKRMNLYRNPQKSIHEIVLECQHAHPRETRYALDSLARSYGCARHDVVRFCPEKELRTTLYNSIRISRESNEALKQLQPYRRLGNLDGLMLPGSREEFSLIQKERMRAVREAEYQRRVMEINRKTPLVCKS